MEANKISITMRHGDLSSSLKDYVEEKIVNIHLEYPKIIQARIILDIEKHLQIAEIILACNNHITIEAEASSRDMYESIDSAIAKITRRMRKYKTRLLKKAHTKGESIKYLDEKIFSIPSQHIEKNESFPSPKIEKESFELKTFDEEEAILALELSDKPFIAYKNSNDLSLEILYRKGNSYALIKPE